MIKKRYSKILSFFARVIIIFIWWDILLPKIGFKNFSRNTRTDRLRKIAKAFRKEAISLGGVMIKVGQFLSARLDVLPREITDELSGLQDEVAPEEFADVRKVVEEEFGFKLEEKFENFDPIPLASASIGQVHLAYLQQPDNNYESNQFQVAVKIQRFNIQEIVYTDLAALAVVARWVMRYPAISKRANIPALLEEFSTSLYEEIDYLHEGKNAETFAVNFSDRRNEVIVPKVIWSHTTKRVLTLEYLSAIKITDYVAIDAVGISRVDVAARLFDTYLKQIFEDHFFHADPHPGNLFVMPDPEGDVQNWKLVFVDFGMAGVVPDFLLARLRDMLIALATRDAGKIVKVYQDLGVLLSGANLGQLEKATAKVFERFWGKTAPEMMKMHHQEAVVFVAEFGDLIYEMPFQVPENMILLVRCLGILSGMCTGLNKEFNVWTSLMPYAQKLVESEKGSKSDLVLKEIERFLAVIFALPYKTESLLQKIEQGKLEVRNPELEGEVEQLNRGLNKIAAAIIFGVLTWAAVQLLLNLMTIPGLILGGASVITLGWVIFSK